MKNLKHTILVVLCIVGLQLTIAQPAPPNGKKWEKVDVLSDEFNGNSLNTSKWLINDPQWEGRRPARFETSSVSVSGGNLKISASKKSNPFSGWTHSGGLVRAKTRSLYGYYETRMKANKTFMSSTFWLINKRNEFTGCDFRTTELDITETVGVNSNGANWVNNTIRNMNSNTHSRGTSCNSTPVGVKGAKAALGGQSWQAYHTYGVWWKSKTEVLLYLDGKFVNKITPAADFNLPMYLRMVVETYDWNPPKAGSDGMNDSVANRTTFYDWVRSYKLVNCNSNCGGNPDPSNGTVTMKGQSINKFISSENGNRSMRAVSNSAGGQEKFIVKSEGNGTVSFKGNNGKYVSSEDGKKTMNCNRNAVGAWEKFTLVPQGGNVYAIRGNNGKYVSHENGSNNGINCNRNAIGAWEKFVINGLNKSSKINNETIIANNIKTYPNPVKTNDPLSMSFKLREETKISVELFNIIGQSVLQNNLGSFKEGNHDIKLFTRTSQLNSGLYLLKIRMNDIETVNALEFK